MHGEEVMYALSLRQPWAALVVHGLKTIEIRRWSTNIRGPILIHASQIADDRPHGWAVLPESLRSSAELRGGVMGRVDLVSCRAYRNGRHFGSERGFHLNDPEWFHAPVTYGFVFMAARPLPFVSWPGNARFFTVPHRLIGS